MRWISPGHFHLRYSKKRQVCKPGSVSSAVKQRTFIIYLGKTLLLCSLQPTPPDNFVRERNKAGSFAVPQQRQTIRIYLALQPVRRTANYVTTITGALLPHLFTRSPTSRDGYFLLRCYPLSKIFPLRSTVPCVARTFLPPSTDGER